MRRMSQKDLAEKVGVDRSYISKLEQDNMIRKHSPKLILLTQISEALDICPNDILRYKCTSCHRFKKCNRHEYLEKDDEYFKEHFDYYI